MKISKVAMHLIEKLADTKVSGSIDYDFDKENEEERITFWHEDERYEHNTSHITISSNFREEHQRKNLEKIEAVLNGKGEVLLND